MNENESMKFGKSESSEIIKRARSEANSMINCIKIPNFIPEELKKYAEEIQKEIQKEMQKKNNN